MNNIIILVMHGMPPRDFPKDEMAEYFRQYDPFHHVASHGHHHGSNRFLELDEKMKRWPRNPENDLFYGAAFRLAKQLEVTSGCPVLVGFNEFCAPDLTEALETAASRKPDNVFVITPMMTPGGIHSEVDIPNTIRAAKAKHPGVRFEYVWPYDLANVATFLNEQITSHRPERSGAPQS
jgi:sirohydrochlorin cobaltochelatase